MDLRQQLERHRKNTRLVAGALGLLLVILAVAYYIILRGRDLPSTLVTNKVLLFVLRNINVLLILVILFVLGRNLVKLWIERRAGALGSKLKTKLVATFIGLTLVPGILLFLYAAELLQGSIERWFATPLRGVLEQGNAVSQALHSTVESHDLRAAALVAREIQGFDLDEPSLRPRLALRLQDLRAEMGLEFLGVYEETELVHAVLDSQSGITDLPEPGRAFLRDALEHGQARRSLEPAGTDGRLLLSAAVGRPAANRPRTVVVAGSLLAPEVAAQSERLIEAYQSYRQLAAQKREFKASYLLMFLMVTLLILLASSWVGLYLARRITVPIQALAEGTRRISGGDLDQVVEVEAGDELGVLVDSFNRMTQELRRSRELLERSNRELVAANRRLAEERALIAAVLDNVAAGVLSLDSDGRIFTCNRAALLMLQQREEEVLGRIPAEAWPAGERAKLAELLAREPGEAGRSTTELRLVLGGEWKTFEVKVTAMHDAVGQKAGKVVVLEDLTELIQAQKLAAWSEAARRVAHEIKNPLTPIRLAAERLRERHRQGEKDLGAELEEGVEIIVREVMTMQALVDEFSRFARMPRPQLVAVDLARLIEEVLPLYRGVKAGVEVVSEVPSDLGEVWLDREQIRRALLNLLDNAVEATEAAGRVTVAARRRDGGLEIRISDCGRGIPPEGREKLFLPFFSTKGRGTGLGLAIVHRIVADHHGEIRVEDNSPHGTIFVIELPQR